ncbi:MULTISPECIES: uracil-DNA glycosylase [Gammaproteobacteria]|uniref:uracil-DNA glycosylase n=1 Tax=Gammaproteobacteria TaxID=1236 RepID=UPI000DCF8316|nr:MULTISPECIES: uracil-DNA glycosylase [Gammaproteobacteria]RTE86221.1 uracil-DNA glycosylase [Aliidiomarina sp. B3213]TCZ91572.1 uracil-DNA glycosylase [Lysobacter sp. N42]
MALNFPEHWFTHLSEPAKQALQSASQWVSSERAKGKTIYPSDKDMFNALADLSPEQVEVVILGQDPYHGEGQAHGYAFSVPYGVKTPPSLVNMYKALESESPGFNTPSHGCLTSWSKQGVLLLNTGLSVEAGKAGSHSGQGWEQVTKDILRILSEGKPKVFVLWGGHAKRVIKGLNMDGHVVLKGTHPSPLSAYRGFYEERHFEKVNEALRHLGYKEINWNSVCDDLFN